MGNFFIIGCGRSGTSIIQKLLASHSQIAIPPETGLYSIILKKLSEKNLFPIENKEEVIKIINTVLYSERIKDLPIPKEVIKERVLKSIPLERAKLVSILLDEFARVKNKKFWGEKTPRHVIHINEVYHDFPHSKFIFVVRDPRAVAASFKSVDASFGSKNVTVPIRQWLDAAISINNATQNLNDFKDRVLTVKYEDLVKNKNDTLLKIQHFLGIPVEELESYSAEIVFHKNQVKHMKNTERELFDSSLTKWKNELSRSEVIAIDYALGDEMKKFGYKATEGSKRSGALYFNFYKFTCPLERLLRKVW